jgi:CRP/FNR family transcriptional regulator, cyclic AMP receptor protein
MDRRTIEPCQVTFVKRDDFLQFLKAHNEACFRVAEELSQVYNNACQEIRSLGGRPSAGGRLANLLLQWRSRNDEASTGQPGLKLALTQEEMAQMIGTARETVTRLLLEFQKRQLLQYHGSTLFIRNKKVLRSIAGAEIRVAT